MPKGLNDLYSKIEDSGSGSDAKKYLAKLFPNQPTIHRRGETPSLSCFLDLMHANYNDDLEFKNVRTFVAAQTFVKARFSEPEQYATLLLAALSDGHPSIYLEHSELFKLLPARNQTQLYCLFRGVAGFAVNVKPIIRLQAPAVAMRPLVGIRSASLELFFMHQLIKMFAVTGTDVSLWPKFEQLYRASYRSLDAHGMSESNLKELYFSYLGFIRGEYGLTDTPENVALTRLLSIADCANTKDLKCFKAAWGGLTPEYQAVLTEELSNTGFEETKAIEVSNAKELITAPSTGLNGAGFDHSARSLSIGFSQLARACEAARESAPMGSGLYPVDCSAMASALRGYPLAEVGKPLQVTGVSLGFRPWGRWDRPAEPFKQRFVSAALKKIPSRPVSVTALVLASGVSGLCAGLGLGLTSKGPSM